MNFTIEMSKLQPSQLYINEEKYMNLRDEKEINQPILIKEINGDLVIIDGHTRAICMWKQGKQEILAQWEKDVINEQIYNQAIKWCKEEAITHISDLKNSIVSATFFKENWIEKCQQLMEK